MLQKEIKAAIVTCVANRYLYWKTLPYLKRTGFDLYWFDGSTGIYGLKFLLTLFRSSVCRNYDVLIVSDEDNIIVSPSSLRESLKDFVNSGETFRGCREGGDVALRAHSPIMINTFFSFFNVKKVLENFNESEILKITTIEKEDLVNWQVVTDFTGKHKFDLFSFFEPYYSFFLYYRRAGHSIGYWKVRTSNDDITTEILDRKETTICHHTWYARKFGIDEFHTNRILKVFKKASNGKTIRPAIFLPTRIINKKKEARSVGARNLKFALEVSKWWIMGLVKYQ